MTTPWRAVSAQTVAGWMEPSRWRCSSALGKEAIRSESTCGVIRDGSARQLRAAGVSPGSKPEGAHIRGRIGELANQYCRGLIVEAVVILVGERVFAVARVAIGHENGFQPTM